MLTITGQYFGDDCLDTGTVPPGVGALGNPLTGLAIVIDQGEREFLVATGSADSDYSFQVDVVVPSELEPGEASMSIIGAGDARLTINPAARHLQRIARSAPPRRQSPRSARSDDRHRAAGLGAATRAAGRHP